MYADSAIKQEGIDIEEIFLADNMAFLKTKVPEILLAEVYFRTRPGFCIDGRVAYKMPDGSTRIGPMDFKTTSQSIHDYPHDVIATGTMGTYLIGPECHHTLDNSQSGFLVLLSHKDAALYVFDYTKIKVIDTDVHVTDKRTVRIGLPSVAIIKSLHEKSFYARD